MSQLPEVREADASPEIAAIYADIKESAALPQVNLIFRYFATKEGALEWIWPSLRPLYRSTELAEAVHLLTQSIERPGLSPLMAALTGDELAACKRVIDCLQQRQSAEPHCLDGIGARARKIRRDPLRRRRLTPRDTKQAPEGAIAFPALPKRDELDPTFWRASRRWPRGILVRRALCRACTSIWRFGRRRWKPPTSICNR